MALPSLRRTLYTAASVLPLLILGASEAMAAPNRVAWTVEGVKSARDISAFQDGTLVLFVDAASQVGILDTGSWSVETLAACSGGASSVGVVEEATEWPRVAWVGCADGEAVPVEVYEDGTAITGTPVVVEKGTSIEAIRANEDYVFAVVIPKSSNPVVHVIESSTSTLDGLGVFPSTLNLAGMKDVELTGNALIVVHGSDDLSEMDIATGNASLPGEMMAGRELMECFILEGAVLLADSSGGILQYQTGSNEFALLEDLDGASFAAVAGYIGETESFALAYDSGSSEILVWDMSFDTNPSFGEELWSFQASDVGDFVVADGYVVGAGSAGVQVITDRPWIDNITITPSEALGDGGLVTVAFTADLDGEWELLLGGSSQGDGDSLGQGSLIAGATVETSFSIDSSFEEGENALWILVDSQGLVGRHRTAVTVDNPPPAPVLTSSNVIFGNQQITLSLDENDEADLAGYLAWFTVTPFDPKEWETGGPTFDGPDEIKNPIALDATPGQKVNYTISPLTNEVTYHIALRAIDEGGKESIMSNVVTATPRETLSASMLAGEQGGYCGTSTRAGLAAILLSLLPLLARRRPARALMLLGLLAVPLLPSLAQAREGDATRGNFEVRYGPFNPSDSDIKAVYGQGHGVLWLEGGPRIGSFAEIDLGVGFWQDLGATVAVDSGEASGEHSMITAWPVTLGATVRLDFFKEQILVPTATAGLDYWLWKENWYVNPDVGGTGEEKGGKAGMHYGFGADLLLDALQPSRASRLTAVSGIEDTYIVGELRWQEVGQWSKSKGLTLDGFSATFGLKFDF